MVFRIIVYSVRGVKMNGEKLNVGDQSTLTSSTFKLARALVPVAVLKQTVNDVIKSLPDDESSRQYMLYMLRVFDNPQILEADVKHIQKEQDAKRILGESINKAKAILLALIGLGLSALFTFLITKFGIVL